ncbi:hypothetical protein EJB05_55874 [Eragrostis curvula]|uniref:F-box domain-containing protein n=1 Tax=Eragrostis curvula TaxID=38414 RepID=A0A5J9SIV9_9POAL|nr:hypothetical protein EJB05_55874 [Eragrostis curvula]
MTISSKRRTVVASGGAQVLPEEMIIEVFLYLPIKSILRFRAVCRSWATMLSSEEFCSLHMAKTEATSALPKLFFTSSTANFDATEVYLGSSSGPGDDLLFSLNDIRGDFVDMTPAPCRGLTLVDDAVAPAYFVFNAATRAVTRLPPCQAVAFATAGLGFDAWTKNYKVVRLFRGNLQDKQRIRCEVYTLGSDCWRPAIGGIPFRFCRAADCAIGHSIRDKQPPVFADGFLHWLLDPFFVAHRPRNAILSFSITDETFRCVQSPPFGAPGVRIMEHEGHLCAVQERLVSGLQLVELAGRLCMLRDLRNASSNCSALEIWNLNDYSSGGWSLKHRIDLLAHVARDLVEPQIVKVIGSVGDCESMNKVIITTSKRKVILYDPMLETLETILKIRGTQFSYQTEHSALRVSLLKETLVPVRQTTEEVGMVKAAREILLRIPADHVVQLKLVCKQWRKLIENQSFIRSYYLHHNTEKRPNIMLVGKGTRRSQFSFLPLKKLLQRCPSRDTWLNTKVVCSKPCHGLNLLSTEMKDYLYNPCTGYCFVNQTRGRELPGYFVEPANHAFAVDKKIVGLGFNMLKQEHVIVEFFYLWKDFRNRCPAFVVELEGILCAVLTNPVEEKLYIWKLKHGRWNRAYTVYLKGWSGYSLQTNVVVPWAVDPKDGRILLNTGRKVGLYDPSRRFIETLYDLDEVLGVKGTEQSSGLGVYDGIHITKCKNSVNKYGAGKPPLQKHRVFDDCSPTSRGNNFACSSATQSLEEIIPSYTGSMPLIPILYEESLESYPPWWKRRTLHR